MSRTPEISIIVPVYQAAATIRLCVNSVLNQTFKDWELLLIDDGSDDDSLFQCQQMADDNERIRVFAQKHQGVSAARNSALTHVRTPYVCFVDADDVIEPDYLHSLYQYKEYDMVICGYYVDKMTSDGTILKQEQHLPADIDIQLIEKREMLEPLFLTGMININCNKLLQSSIIKEHNLSFSRVPINEDYLFMVDYMEHCHSLRTICKPLYHWQRVNEKKTGLSSLPDNIMEIYNEAHIKTMTFFQSKQIAGKVMYFSYYFLILKYYNEVHDKTLRDNYLKDLMRNSYVQDSFKSHHPSSYGELLMNTLLRTNCFRTFHLLHQYLLKL